MQDEDTQQAQIDSRDSVDRDKGNENSTEFGNIVSDDISLQTFLKLVEHGQSSRTRALRLKENDVIVAIDGISYHDTIDNMVDLLSSGEEGEMWLLTIWRNGKFFEVFLEDLWVEFLNSLVPKSHR